MKQLYTLGTRDSSSGSVGSVAVAVLVLVELDQSIAFRGINMDGRLQDGHLSCVTNPG